MLVLHVIPVGRSLLDQIARGTLPELRSALVADELPGLAVTVSEALRQATGRNQELDLDCLGLTDVPRTVSALGPAMAAEWTSMAAVAAERRYGVVDGETCVFIATDTEDGLRAATLLAARYQPAIRYLHEPLSAGRPVLEPGDVYVCRVPDLDLGIRKPTSATWRSLGAVGRLVADTAGQIGRGDWEVVLHLSGGHQAMIPYLMVMAEGVHSRLRDLPLNAPHRATIRAVAIHDSSLERRLIVIDIPVRAIEGNLLSDVRKLTALAWPDSDLVNAGIADDLLGSLIEKADERTRRLTEAGLIMVNVL
ncbi:MAG: hypothetical protein ACRDTC_01850 [Pseudonocardiaceae bacterium]